MHVIVEVYGGIVEGVTMIADMNEAVEFADNQAEAANANFEKDDIRVFAFDEGGGNEGVECYDALSPEPKKQE